MTEEARTFMCLKAWHVFILQLHKVLGVIHQVTQIIVFWQVFAVTSWQILAFDYHCRDRIVVVAFH
jgi:hypothetical protein